MDSGSCAHRSRGSVGRKERDSVARVDRGSAPDPTSGAQRDDFAGDDLVYVPGIDLPRSRYSRTDGLRNPGGTAGASFVGLFLSSTGSS